MVDRSGADGKGLQVRRDNACLGGRWCLEVLPMRMREWTSEVERCLFLASVMSICLVIDEGKVCWANPSLGVTHSTQPDRTVLGLLPDSRATSRSSQGPVVTSHLAPCTGRWAGG